MQIDELSLKTGFGANTDWIINSEEEIEFLPRPLVYKANLTQSGENAPVPTVFVNTIGAIVWTRVDVGEYRATLAGAFPANVRTRVVAQMDWKSNAIFVGHEWLSDAIIGFFCLEADMGTSVEADSIIQVLIEVYPGD